MTSAQLLALIRRKTNTTTTTYPDADVLIDVNLAIEDLAGDIQKAREHIWEITALDDLVADQRLYAFPADILNRMTDLELMFVAGNDYVQAKPSARRHYNDVLQESVIINNFNNDDPQYFIRRKAIYILSGAIIAVTDGIKLVYNAFPAVLVNLTGSDDLSVDPSTTTHGFPREFHPLLATKVSMGYKSRNNLKLNQEEADFYNDLERKLDAFSCVDSSKVVRIGLPVSDSDFGYNY